MKYTNLIFLIVGLVNILGMLFLYTEFKAFVCDTGTGFLAERRFTYPSIRKVGNPDETAYYPNGKEVINPVTSSRKWMKKCP